MWPHDTLCDFNVCGSMYMLEQQCDDPHHTFLPRSRVSLGFHKSPVKFNKGQDPFFPLFSSRYEQDVFMASVLCHRTLSTRRRHAACWVGQG